MKLSSFIPFYNIGGYKTKPIFFKFRSSPTYVLITVSIAMFVNMVTYSLIVPIVPFIIDALNKGLPVDSGGNPYNSKVEDDGDVSRKTGIMLALYAVGLLIGSPFFGYLGDRMTNRKYPMLLGILGLIVATMLFLFVTQYYQFLIARALQGLADANCWTLGMTLVADAYPVEQLGAKMGIVLIFHSAGLVAGAPIGGGLYQSFGYKSPFIFCIVVAGLDFFLRLFMVERRDCPPEWFEDEKKKLSKEQSSMDSKVEQVTCSNSIEENNDNSIIQQEEANNNEEVATIDNAAEEPKVKPQVSTWALLSHPRLIAAALLSFAYGTVFNVFEPTLTVKLSTEYGLNSSQIGLVFLAQMIPTFISTPGSGWLSDNYGPKIVCIINLPLCAMFVILMGTQNQYSPGGVAPLIVLFTLQGLTAFAILTPALPEIALVAQAESEKVGGDTGTGRSYSIFNMAFGVGALVGPLLGGFLYGEIGFFYLCVVMGCFLFSCIPYIYVYTGEPGKLIDYRRRAKKNLEKEEDVESSSTPSL